ncbi:MAG: hypothetical protein AB8C13_06385 [Phycisphaerales bacterium]
MDPDLQSNSKKPTWEVHARPLDAPHEPWQTMRVSARSAIQAAAILNRKGYEMAVQTAMRVSSEPDTISIAQLQPLECVQCGYALAGLQLNKASVTCPECSYPQPLFVWRAEQNKAVDKNHPIIGIFAVIGMVGFMFFMIFVVLIVIAIL